MQAVILIMQAVMLDSKDLTSQLISINPHVKKLLKAGWLKWELLNINHSANSFSEKKKHETKHSLSVYFNSNT